MADIISIVEPTADEILRDKIQRHYQKQNRIAIDANQKLAIVLLKLNPAEEP